MYYISYTASTNPNYDIFTEKILVIYPDPSTYSIVTSKKTTDHHSTNWFTLDTVKD
jgi:hypothetical protein